MATDVKDLQITKDGGQNTKNSLNPTARLNHPRPERATSWDRFARLLERRCLLCRPWLLDRRILLHAALRLVVVVPDGGLGSSALWLRSGGLAVRGEGWLKHSLATARTHLGKSWDGRDDDVVVVDRDGFGALAGGGGRARDGSG